MQQAIRPFIAFAFLLTITFVVLLFLIQQTERTNREMDFATPLLPAVSTESPISKEEFFPAQDSSIDTKNWKIYTDKKYGFQFRYPNDLVLRVSPSYSDAGGERGISLGSKNFPIENYWMSMGVFEGDRTPQEISQYLIGGAASGETIQNLETKINGHKIYLSKETVGGASGIGTINYSYSIALSDHAVLWIDFRGFPIDKTGKEWQYLPIGQAIVHSLILSLD